MSPLIHKILMQGAVAGMATAADDAIQILDAEIERLKAKKAAKPDGKLSIPRLPAAIDSFPPSIITKGMRHVLVEFYRMPQSANDEQAADFLFKLYQRKQIDLPTIAGIVEKTLSVQSQAGQTTTQ